MLKSPLTCVVSVQIFGIITDLPNVVVFGLSTALLFSSLSTSILQSSICKAMQSSSIAIHWYTLFFKSIILKYVQTIVTLYICITLKRYWVNSFVLKTIFLGFFFSVSPILGQFLDLICPAKINLFEPRLEFYNPFNMAN